jgi:hypothetical protein
MPRHEIRLTTAQEADLRTRHPAPEGVVETKRRKPASKRRGPDKRKRKTRSDAGTPRKTTTEPEENEE